MTIHRKLGLVCRAGVFVSHAAGKCSIVGDAVDSCMDSVDVEYSRSIRGIFVLFLHCSIVICLAVPFLHTVTSNHTFSCGAGVLGI